MWDGVFNWGDLANVVIICLFFICGVISMSGFTDDTDKKDKE